MDITFDDAADALYIRFQPAGKRVKKTVKLQDGLLVDLDAAGRIFGIELLDVSRRMSVEKALGHVNLHLPVHV